MHQATYHVVDCPIPMGFEAPKGDAFLDSIYSLPFFFSSPLDAVYFQLQLIESSIEL